MEPAPQAMASGWIEPLNRQQIERLRSMSGERRFRIGFEICEFVTRFALAGIRYRHPEASDADAQRLLSHLISSSLGH